MTFISYAQNFEDVMLWRALQHVKDGFYIDIGAAWPDFDSVTKAFYERGWSGVNVEPNPKLHKLYKKARPRDTTLRVAVSDQEGSLHMNFIGETGLSTLDDAIAARHRKAGWTSRIRREVPVITLASLWEQHVPPRQAVHFLKVDVEGLEESVLRGNDWSKCRPWIVVVEATLPMTQDESFISWERILLDAGYLFAYADGLNRFYVSKEHSELLDSFAYPPNVFDEFVLYAQQNAVTKAHELEQMLAQAEAQRDQADMQALETRHALEDTKTSAFSMAEKLVDLLHDRNKEWSDRLFRMPLQSAPMQQAEQSWQTARPQVSGQFVLAEDYTIGEAEWQTYLGDLLRLRFPQEKRESPTALRLNVVVDGQKSDEDALQRTQTSINLLTRRTGCTVNLYWRGESPGTLKSFRKTSTGQLLELLKPDDLVLWLKPGDEVHPELVYAIADLAAEDASLVLFDLYWREDQRVHPVLFSAVDPVLAESGCYFLGRYLTTGQQVASAFSENPQLTSDELGKTLACNRHLDGRHIPLPLIKADIDKERFRQMRDAMTPRAPIPFDADGTVSAIICTKNCGLLLEQLIGQLLLNPAIRDIVVVANNPTNEYALNVIRRTSSMPRCTVLDYPEEYNFSKQCNLGAEYAQGEHLLFINDDIAPVSHDWLHYLLSWMDRPRIVGPLLVYPDQSIQHAGMFLGFNGVAGHSLRGGSVPDCDPDFMLSVPHQVSAVTGAVMLMQREVFEDLNGFDFILGVYLQDVDLCLRATQRKIELVFDPRAVLIHMESVSIKPVLGNTRIRSRREREREYYRTRWGERTFLDPHLSPLIDRSNETLRLLKL